MMLNSVGRKSYIYIYTQFGIPDLLTIPAEPICHQVIATHGQLKTQLAWTGYYSNTA
jgi:hypothetical protein